MWCSRDDADSERANDAFQGHHQAALSHVEANRRQARFHARERYDPIAEHIAIEPAASQ